MQLQTTYPTPFDLCRRTAREDCLITSREKLQFLVAEEQLASGVAARGLEPRPTGRWQALLQGFPAVAIDMDVIARQVRLSAAGTRECAAGTRLQAFAATCEGPKVCGLTTGAEWIRTVSSAVDWQQFVVSSELGPIYRRTVVRAVAGLGEPIELSDGVRAPPLTALIRRRHTKVALSAVRAHRGSKGSNSSPSSAGSALWLRARRNLTHLFWIDH